MTGALIQLIVAIAVLIICWIVIERFSPDPTITFICKIVIFVIALILCLKLLLPMVGV
jgi:hypothetical protein